MTRHLSRQTIQALKRSVDQKGWLVCCHCSVLAGRRVRKPPDEFFHDRSSRAGRSRNCKVCQTASIRKVLPRRRARLKLMSNFYDPATPVKFSRRFLDHGRPLKSTLIRSNCLAIRRINKCYAEGRKTCTICKQEKAVGLTYSDFYKSYSSGDGFQYQCKTCMQAKSIAFRKRYGSKPRGAYVRRDCIKGFISPNGLSRRAYYLATQLSTAERLEAFGRRGKPPVPPSFRIPAFEYRAKRRKRLVRIRRALERIILAS